MIGCKMLVIFTIADSCISRELDLASKIMFGWFNSSGASPVGRVGGTIKLSLLYTRESLLLYIVCTAMIVDKQERGDMVCQLLPWDQ